MNRRSFLIGLAALLCLATLTTALFQREQLTVLRAEQRRLLAESATPAKDAAPVAVVEPASGAPDVSPELLRLRSEVTRLTRQRDELGSAAAENQRLRDQANQRATNAAPGAPLPPGYVGADQHPLHVVDLTSVTLPPGYVRASQARLAGYSTPEDTLESMLWALHNRDVTNLLQAFTPGESRNLQKQAGGSGAGLESFLQNAAAIPGLSIVSREELPDGSISMKAEIAPGLPFAPIRFRQINGQWKMEMGR